MPLTTDFSKSSESTLFSNQQNAADLRQREDLCRAFPLLERDLDGEHLDAVSNAALVAAGILLIAALAYLIGRALLAAWQGGGR